MEFFLLTQNKPLKIVVFLKSRLQGIKAKNVLIFASKIEGGGGNQHFRHLVLAIFHIFGVNVEKIKRRNVQKVWVMDIRCQGKSCSQLCIRHVYQDFGAL